MCELRCQGSCEVLPRQVAGQGRRRWLLTTPFSGPRREFLLLLLLLEQQAGPFALLLSSLEVVLLVVVVFEEEVRNRHQRVDEAFELPGGNGVVYGLPAVRARRKAEGRCFDPAARRRFFGVAAAPAKGVPARNQRPGTHENVQTDGTVDLARYLGRKVLVLRVYRHRWRVRGWADGCMDGWILWIVRISRSWRSVGLAASVAQLERIAEKKNKACFTNVRIPLAIE